METSLPAAILQAFKIFTPSVMTTTLPNIVADYGGYEACPPAKQILKEIVSQGYGQKMYTLYTDNAPWQKKIQSYSSEFISNTGYKEELVEYVFASLEYGLGWLFVEPELNINNDEDSIIDLTGKSSNLDAERQLILLQKKYISMLNSLIVIPEGKLYKKSGYYSAQAISDLWVIENEIGILSKDLCKDNASWCETEKDKVLQRYHKSRFSQLFTIFVKIGIPILIVLSAAYTGISYLSSKEEIAEYNKTMSLGRESLEQENYENAISYYSAAMDQYDGAFAKAHKKRNAKNKAVEAAQLLFNKSISSANRLIKQGHYYDAQLVLSNLSKYTFNNQLKERLTISQNNLQDVINKAITDGKNALLTSISTNGRKLDSSSRENLNELLKVSPDDYWLNFILQKTR